MNEWLMIASMATGSICFAIGGTGFRFVRFAIMPLILGLICLKAGFIWWKDLGLAVSFGIVLTLGYGEKVKFWRKCLVFLGYGLSSVWIGFSYWQIICPVGCLGLYCLSNFKYTANTFVWKICEFLMGSLIGIEIASLIKG